MMLNNTAWCRLRPLHCGRTGIQDPDPPGFSFNSTHRSYSQWSSPSEESEVQTVDREDWQEQGGVGEAVYGTTCLVLIGAKTRGCVFI